MLVGDSIYGVPESPGMYLFELTVTDQEGTTAYGNVVIQVEGSAVESSVTQEAKRSFTVWILPPSIDFPVNEYFDLGFGPVLDINMWTYDMYLGAAVLLFYFPFGNTSGLFLGAEAYITSGTAGFRVAIGWRTLGTFAFRIGVAPGVTSGGVSIALMLGLGFST